MTAEMGGAQPRALRPVSVCICQFTCRWFFVSRRSRVLNGEASDRSPRASNPPGARRSFYELSATECHSVPSLKRGKTKVLLNLVQLGPNHNT